MRSLFIAMEVIVAGTFCGLLVSDYWFQTSLDIDSSPVSLCGFALVAISWLFLLLGSPFYVRSFRRVALVGWGIGVGVLVLSAFLPAR